jgi:hypothetical protein
LYTGQATLVDVGEAPLTVEGKELIGDPLKDVLDLSARFLELLLGSLAIGDVLEDMDDVAWLPGRLAPQRCREVTPDGRAVLPYVAVLHREGP